MVGVASCCSIFYSSVLVKKRRKYELSHRKLWLAEIKIYLDSLEKNCIGEDVESVSVKFAGTELRFGIVNIIVDD